MAHTYIVLRLVPPTAVDSATFTGFLNALVIKVYDVSYANAVVGGNPPGPAFIGNATLGGPPSNGIVQHITGFLLQSVATAVIEYTGPPPGGHEYVAPDLRIELDQGTNPTVFGSRIYYEVQMYTQAAPIAANQYQTIPPGNVSAYVPVPPPLLSATTTTLQIPTDGTPPNFDDLMAAVTAVLKQDPAAVVTPALISGLSVQQCQNIAYEIVYGPQPPLPGLPDTLEDMYTSATNDGVLVAGTPNTYEENRLAFEGALSGYYGKLDSVAIPLANYVYALAAAVYCEIQTQNATQALVEFPVNPNATPPPPLTTEPESAVIFQGALGIDIPAQYFYALTYDMPIRINMQDRFQRTTGADQQSNLNRLTDAVTSGWITVNPGTNPAQAVRILEALYVPASTTVPPWVIGGPVFGAAAGLIWGDWSTFPTLATWQAYAAGDDIPDFWSGPPPGEAEKRAAAFLDMVLVALTQGYQILSSGHYLAADIENLLLGGIGNVAQLAGAAPSDWQALFAALPADAVPSFIHPGSVGAFISYLQKFFQMGLDPGPGAGPAPSGPPTFLIPAFDLIQNTISAYAGFAFGGALVLAQLEAAAAAAIPGDPQAQAWAVQAVWTINELFILANIPEPPSFQFSVMEALFARGFTTREQVQDLEFADFQQALTGTVAYDFATPIYANAGPPIAFPPPPPPGFGPINPCCLTDCIPPSYLSPLGPIAYLHEMLKVSERSTCDHPFAPPAAGHTILQAHIDDRRGPVENLAVTRANLETPIPLIDLVNECLEYMASTSPITKHGTVYDTSEDALAGYKLCTDECCCREDHDHKHDHKHEHKDHCHKPVVLFEALPEYSTPATPVAANSAVEPAVWDKLKDAFSTCCLPYDQALDVSRTYFEHFRTCRYEEMRTFRKCITEFVLDPVNQPAHFQTHLWRYPVRIDIAIEYLGISREEYATLFHGVWPRSCAHRRDEPREPQNELQCWQLYGFASEHVVGVFWTDIAVRLPEFLKRTCLTYCEFIELWKCGPVKFRNGHDRKGIFPDCEPCCLEDLWLEFGEDTSAGLCEIAVFIRLWRKLKHVCGADYTFCQLADICQVLHFPSPDFIRQLAAFQMLRDQFRLKLTGEEIPPGATGADRTYLLSLWVGPAAAHWDWAIQHLIEGIAFHAKCRHECKRREPEFLKLLASNFDSLSRLAGFDPAAPPDTWHAAPTHTLRFAEVLAKIYASNFSIGEILFLFTADPHLDGEDPFALQDENEAEDEPLGLPEEEHKHSLWELRRKLLQVEMADDEAHHWTWQRIESDLTHEFGFNAADVLTFGEHFFPHVLETHGHPVTSQARRFLGALAVTTPAMWNAPPEGPFHYDAVTHNLWAVLPLSDQAVLAQLIRVQALKPPEQQAVQDVYFQPRVMLSAFALLFSNFGEAERRLIEEKDQEERWRYFQRQFSLCHARCRVLAKHLSEHVEAATRQECPEGTEAALLLLKKLYADENFATADWENDDGRVPPVTWTPPPSGGALAALLGLVGTGLEGEFRAGGHLAWREVRGPLRAFGHERDLENCPVPTVIPSMGLVLTPQQMQSVTVRNGFAMEDAKGRWLGGAEGFTVKWHGALLIDEEGEYRFHAGAPAREKEEPSVEAARHRSWKVILKRGQKTWILLRHHWHSEEDLLAEALHLRRGAYEFSVELVQHEPEYLSDAGEIHPQHTGFEIKYSGPDSHHELVTIPHSRLCRILKHDTLAVAGLAGSPASFLNQLYTSSLRDIRRTYQRAFKALLFSHRFALSAKPHAGEGSELGYMLARKKKFAGSSCYRAGGPFKIHRADFDFNFLPVTDDYHSPAPAQDARAHPSPQRTQAMFDWWERIFDYDRARREVRSDCERHLWLLFAEAFEKQPADPTSLLRHMCADARHWPLDLHFFQDQFSPIYDVTSDDLEDDRWMVRAWHADRWLRRLWHRFTVLDMSKARPDLWASDNPSALVLGQTETGNANLLRFLCDGCFENGEPRRYEDVERLNDGLRERGREALLSYLCGPHGIVHTSKELSEILLLDVRAGRCERASRIEEAISAVQTFIQRSRLGLEAGWIITKAFAEMWDFRFATYHIWQACKRRELYKENWIDWDELEKAKKIEAFSFLDEELKRLTLTIAEPGGVDYWPDDRPPTHPGLCLLQHRDPAEMQILPAAREGLNLLATPERDARPSWITMVPDQSAAPSPPGTVAGPVGPGAATSKLPFWMECAIRLGTRFIRVAAAPYPPASTEFEPRHECGDELGHPEKHKKKDECCVSCCKECGCEHPAHVDEYYFWLVEAKYFEPDPNLQTSFNGFYDGQQNEYYDQNAQVATPWHDTGQLPGLLEWPSEPMVRLAWCRVHNDEFQQPRRSVWGVAVDAGATPDLTFQGRVSDSLYFDVTNSVTGAGGFRYDMVPDLAIESENLAVPAVSPFTDPPFPFAFTQLFAYPYFAYFQPGARLFPWSLYSPSVAVAHALRAHCRFEAALKWYDLVYDPFDRDNRWARCEKEKETQPPPTDPNQPPQIAIQVPASVDVVLPPPSTREHSCCCDTTKVSCHEARHRSILLHYLEALLEWADAVMRRNSPEAFQQVSLLLDTMRKIMGPHPHMVNNCIHVKQTVATFDPLHAPINPRLMMLYDRLDDRVGLIHDCLSARRLREACEKHDAQYWGDDPVRDGWRSTLSLCCDGDDWCHPRSPYRFVFLIQKAKESAAQVKELGAELLAAFEKGDAEFVASVRVRHERELAHMARKAREDQWRDADWQVQALEKTKAADQSNRIYYAQLIANGLNQNELGYEDEIGISTGSRTAANVMETIAEAMDVIPDVWVGEIEDVQLPIGTKLSGLFKTLARISNTIADSANSSASLDLTEAGWDRRRQDWVQQVAVLDIQIEQVELQILGAERRRHQALRELDIQQRQIEQATEVLDILRDKFTNHAAYLFFQKHVADLYYQAYELALREARQAERAFNYERGYTARKFIGCENWDNLHEGLLAGERLQLDLARMEKEYCDLNRREYELTKHISMRLQFPREFLRLKVTGRCEIDIAEWMFDLDYPGQYMRRIKNITLTIPCVSGPYNEVHCRLTLLRSATRVDPHLTPPAACCCDCERPDNPYQACLHDPRIVREYGATEAIATSTGQNDAGLFELSFHDDRYLPFEFRGAISLLRFELPHENNYFPMETLSDLILHVNYTSRESGERTRQAARKAAERELPGQGWCLFDIPHDFADAWDLLNRDRRERGHDHHDYHYHHRRDHDDHCREEEERRCLILRFGRNLFPFIPGERELYIEEMELLFNRCEHCGCECPQECPCCMDPTRARYEVELQSGRGREEQRFPCVLSKRWPGLYHGSVETRIGPLPCGGERTGVKLCFPEDMCCITRAYLLCRYVLEERCTSRKEVTPLRCNPCDSA